MDKHQQVLVKLLSAAVRGKKVDDINYSDIDWKAVYDEARGHEVYTLIYPMVKELAFKYKIKESLMATWQNAVLFSGMVQVQHIQQMEQVISTFNQASIPVIALKGLVLRELYPNPALRTMSDADILVHIRDIDKAKDLLMSLGYEIYSFDDKHIHFHHRSYLPLELHQSIIHYDRFNHVPYLENSLWANAVETRIGNVPVLSFCPLDQLIHICLHMAAHVKGAGFGLRQLCDLVVLVENHMKDIDWSLFVDTIKDWHIDIFVKAIFVVCNRLFGMDIPEELGISSLDNDPYIDLLIDDILAGGVYGKNTEDRVISSLQMHFAAHDDNKGSKGHLLSKLSILFPSPKKLGKRYSYAKKYPVLAPVAWGHRLVYALIRKDLSSSAKKNLIYSSKQVKTTREERSRLLHWLQLR